MANDNRTFLDRFGSFLIDGLEATAALKLQQEFLPHDDRVFTATPVGATPVGVPTPTGVPRTGIDSTSLMLLGVAAFAVFKLAT